MKGVSTEVIIFALLALVIVIAAIFFFSGRLGPAVTQMSKEECEQKMQSACASFRSTGNPSAFKNIPETCANTLNVLPTFRACLSGSTNQCINMCENIEMGIVSPGEIGSLGEIVISEGPGIGP